ncbi:TPA: hypothetical protein ACIKY6_001825 [Campylobacter jejuni]|uniref:Uncharacterized protein n=1 Tax=Campylobacter jejuni TaxID=197 RepID=A0A431EED6_CAMJU|nr:hypothetical protein [Campylobacter jejuni]RTJ79603.1 hypothetical protein C3H57_04330 [Campylobacter jejuni]
MAKNVFSRMFEGGMGVVYRYMPNLKAYKGKTEINGTVRETGLVEVNPTLDDPFYQYMTAQAKNTLPVEARDKANNYIPVSKALIQSVSSVSNSKKEYIKKIDGIKNYSLAESIVTAIASDVFEKHNDKSLNPRFFSARVDSPLITDEVVNSFLDKFNLEVFLRDYIFELLWYGEYTFKVDWENLELDDFDGNKECLSCFSRGRFKYVIRNQKTNKGVEQLAYSTGNYVSFRLFSSSQSSTFEDSTGANIFIRLSRGIFSDSAIALLETLRLLETLIPITEINSISSKSQFYLRMEMGTDVRTAYDRARTYELMLKGLMGSTSLPSDLTSLLEQMTQVKVIPTFAGQGDLEQQTIEKPPKIDLTYINDLRGQLANLCKVSRKFVIPDAENGNDADYLKLLGSIRKTLANSVKHMTYNYIKYFLGVDITYDQIHIDTPKIQGLDELDTIEYSNMFTTTMSDITKMIDDISNTIQSAKDNNQCVDMNSLVEFFNAKTRPIYGVDLFKVPVDEEEETQPEDSYDDPNSSNIDNLGDDDNDDSEEGTEPPEGVNPGDGDTQPEVDDGLLK